MKPILLMLREAQPRPTQLAALAALIALLAAALLATTPAQADGHPDDIELVLSLVGDSDNVVAPGAEFTVQAELRFSDPSSQERWMRLAANSNLRISGHLDWEGQTLHRFSVPEGLALGGYVTGVGIGGNLEFNIAALDGRVLVARPSRAGSNNLYVFDTWSKEQVAIITPPTGTSDANVFGKGPNLPIRRDGIQTSAVWHDDSAGVSWIFVGSAWDTVGTTGLVGRFHIYRVDWTVDPVAVTLAKTLAPPSSESSNHQGDGRAVYGNAMVISQDGSTLAVSANEINNVGAVYVYSRPDGAGEEWSDIEYADGVKVTPVAIPAWGTATTRPYNPGALNTCDAYCSRVAALTRAGGGRSDFGFSSLGISADGGVLVVGAHTKQYASNTPGGMFNAANRRDNRGEAYVFLAPNGDWRTTPEVTGTLIPAGENASDFDPERHYSPGPMRRVTEPAAVLLPEPWTSATTNQRFGREIEVSDDGATLAVSAHTAASAKTLIFQRASASAWANAGDLLPSATLTNAVTADNFAGIALKGDGSTLLYGEQLYSGQRGRILVYSRPSGGQWTGTIPVGEAATLQAPTPRASGRYGYMRYDLGGERLATVETSEWAPGGGYIWLSDGACTQRVVDGESSWTCPISLGADGAKVVVPLGTEDGVATISGRVMLSVDGVADSAIRLDDELEVTIGTVKEVDSLSFDFATNTKGTSTTSDDEPYPSALAKRSDTTRLLLGILNENGKAAEAGSVASVLFTTSAGRLSTTLGSGCVGGPSASCSLDVTELDATNSDAIPLTIEHLGVEGTATIQVAVVTDDDGTLLEPPPINVILSGPPAALTIAAPTSGVLNVNAETTEGAESSGTDTDRRDQLTLAVTAADKTGNKVALPAGTRLGWVIDADGRRVTNGVEVVWPLGGADNPTRNAAGNLQAQVNVNRDPSAPLPNGEYTLDLRAGAMRATQTFSVSGGPETVALSEPDGSLELGERFSVTATINDASGAPVPDGTRVNWAATPLGSYNSITQLTVQSTTTGGQASASYLVVWYGRTTISAEADGKQDIQVVTVDDATPPPPPPDPASLLSRPGQGPSTWLGDSPIDAAELLSALPGIGSVQMWQYGKWLRYAVSEGRVVPGSNEFSITPNAIIWLGP